MNIHARIWQMITDKVADLLPTVTVTREYNALAKLESLEDGTPRAFVTLENKGRERISSQTIFDVYVFQVWLVEANIATISDMDARLELLDTVADAFSLKRLDLSDSTGPVVLYADEETETLGGNPFDLGDFIDSGLFSVKFSITVKHERAA